MSYAIIRTGGKQFRVEPGKKYRFPTLVGEAGGSIEFNDVLLGSDGKTVKTGVPDAVAAPRSPARSSSTVSATRSSSSR